jgi:dienelactone hydrolase
LNIDIKTEPASADIYVKEYDHPERDWEHIGVSPIESLRMPIGIFRWKMEKEGYETVLAASSSWDVVLIPDNQLVPCDLVRVLNEKGSVPEGMVRVGGAETPFGKIEDFYIDRFEVTNKQYKEFIDGGGYRNKNYWKHEFIKDGNVLIWEEAMAEFVDLTDRPGPAMWQAGDYPEGEENYPVSGICWYEAAAYAEFAGKTLPTSHHWGIARGEYTPMIQWPQLGGYAIFAPFSNFQGKGTVDAGGLQSLTSYGAYDMAGNVREWCWNESLKGRSIRGGAWNDNPYMFRNISYASPFDRSPQNGFRCALYPDPEAIPDSVFQALELEDARDLYREKPVPDSIFEVYMEHFAFDKTELNAQLESKDETSEDWIKERITFDAAYGGERMIAVLFLPKKAVPPFQTVIYFPGEQAKYRNSSQEIERDLEFSAFLSFLVKNGRAVLYPVLKGTMERRADAMVLAEPETHLKTEYRIQVVKDIKRCIDYLETRQDIDSDKLAYFGMSWGGNWPASVIMAVEERLKTSVLLAGKLVADGFPQVNPINYVSRVKTPTLMINGRYDIHYETNVLPLYNLLGTPEKHKELKTYETDHIPPKNEFIREILAWLDKYLGPVNR